MALKLARRALGRVVRLRPRRGPTFFALNALDEKLLDYIDFDEGFYVEAGANDGLDQSNTAYFERERGWTGVLVEPVPRLADLCRANRPGSIVVEAALVASDFAGSTIPMTDCGLMSVVSGAMRTEADRAEHIRLGSEVQGLDAVDLEVRARTLDSIMSEVLPPQIDLLSLDVEGFELQVLRGFDLGRWKPRFVLIEARYRDEIDAHMAAAGYEVAQELSYHDVLYRNPSTQRDGD